MLYLGLKPGAGRERTSVEFERAMAPRLQATPDARISFHSQSSGTGRDITIMLASNDPAKLDEAARNVLQAMRGIELLRDPRIDGELQRTEIIIRSDERRVGKECVRTCRCRWSLAHSKNNKNTR